MQADHLYKAIEALRNEVIARDVAQANRLDGHGTALTEIKEHLKTLNGRTRKSENSITRLNLVVFGLCPPLILAVVGAVLKAWLG